MRGNIKTFACNKKYFFFSSLFNFPAYYCFFCGRRCDPKLGQLGTGITPRFYGCVSELAGPLACTHCTEIYVCIWNGFKATAQIPPFGGLCNGHLRSERRPERAGKCEDVPRKLCRSLSDLNHSDWSHTCCTISRRDTRPEAWLHLLPVRVLTDSRATVKGVNTRYMEIERLQLLSFLCIRIMKRTRFYLPVSGWVAARAAEVLSDQRLNKWPSLAAVMLFTAGSGSVITHGKLFPILVWCLANINPHYARLNSGCEFTRRSGGGAGTPTSLPSFP